MRYVKRAALVVVLLLLAWAASHAFSHGHESKDWQPLLGEFEPILVPRDGDPHGGRIYRYKRGNGPAVLILHEVYGLTHETLTLAKDIGDRGYSVYVPLLFGYPEPRETIGGMLEVCWRDDFYCWSPNRTSPIVGWLENVFQEVKSRSKGEGVAVIGMCLTGAFPIAFLDDPAVKVVVISQPSLPLRVSPWHSKALGLDREVIEKAQARQRGDSPAKILAFRYDGDLISPKSRLTRIEELFVGVDAEESVDREEYRKQCRKEHPEDYEEKCEDSPHAMLTASRLERVFTKVVDTLAKEMSPPAEGPARGRPDPVLESR